MAQSLLAQHEGTDNLADGLRGLPFSDEAETANDRKQPLDRTSREVATLRITVRRAARGRPKLRTLAKVRTTYAVASHSRQCSPRQVRQVSASLIFTRLAG